MLYKPKNIEVYFALFFLLSGILGLLIYLTPSDLIKASMHWYYLVHFILILSIFPFIKGKIVFIFSPTFLALAYSYSIFIIGGWAFNEELILWKRDLLEFKQWRHVNVMVSYSILCTSLMHFSYFLLPKRFEVKNEKEVSRSKKHILVFLAIICFFTFSLFHLDVTSLGGLGDYSIIPKTLSALILISILAVDRLNSRYLFYLVIIIVFASFSFNDKREAVLLILCIFLMETTLDSNFKIDFKKVSAAAIGIVVVTYLILTMSILRGYGKFGTTSFTDAIVLVPQYVGQDDFIPAFLQNIESVISFFHTHQAIEYIENTPALKTYGETLIKFLYVPIPRSLVDKPVSIIEAYTGHWDLKAYQENVSWPILFHSELYWNFGYWGVFLIIPFFLFFNKCYFILLNMLRNKKVLSALVLLYMYQYFIFFVRGSGLDLYFFYLLLSSLIFILFFLLPYSILVWANSKQVK